MKFSDALDLILEEPRCQWQPLEAAMHIIRKIDAIKQQLLELQNEMSALRSQMKGDLALNVSKSEPKLNIGLDHDEGCRIGIDNKCLRFEPDMQSQVWTVDSSDPALADQFTNEHGTSLKIDSSIDPLIKAISAFFGAELNENRRYNGRIVIEGKLGTMRDLVAWRDGKGFNSGVMPSREVRRLC